MLNSERLTDGWQSAYLSFEAADGAPDYADALTISAETELKLDFIIFVSGYGDDTGEFYYTPTTGDRLLAAWLSLTSTLWNKRLVSTLTYNEAHVLGILLRAEDTARVCTATTLIAQTRLLKSQMNKLLTTLEGKGFICRARSEEDKRVILIRLTDAGRAAYLAEHEHIAGILSQLIDTLGEDRARALTDGINEAVSALEHIV